VPGRSISIVIPAYNEARRLPRTLEKIAHYAASGRAPVGEILVVDDGSRDGTADVVRQTALPTPARCISYRSNAGKGYAIRRGVLEARCDLVLISDADLSTPIEEVEKLLAALESADVAIGSRAVDRSLVRVSQPWHRDRMGRSFNWLIRRITGIPFQDTQCGFKLLPTPAAREMFAAAIIDGFAWDVELILLAGRWDLRVVEVPVLWFNSPQSRVSLVGDPIRMLRDVVRARLRLGRFRDARGRGT
jgi:dolichyl-phosphate beta-glucosyltransferase